MVPLEKQQDSCYKRPSGTGWQGYEQAAQLPQKCLKVFQESQSFSVVSKSYYPACLGSPLLQLLGCQWCVWRDSPFLLFCSDCFILWKQLNASVTKAVDRQVPSLG